MKTPTAVHRRTPNILHPLLASMDVFCQFSCFCFLDILWEGSRSRPQSGQVFLRYPCLRSFQEHLLAVPLQFSCRPPAVPLQSPLQSPCSPRSPLQAPLPSLNPGSQAGPHVPGVSLPPGFPGTSSCSSPRIFLQTPCSAPCSPPGVPSEFPLQEVLACWAKSADAGPSVPAAPLPPGFTGTSSCSPRGVFLQSPCSPPCRVPLQSPCSPQCSRTCSRQSPCSPLRISSDVWS